MAEFQRTQLQVDTMLDARRSGSVALVVGWIVLGMAALMGVLSFAAVRDGDSTWLWFIGILAVIGLVAVAGGSVVRSRRT